MNVDLIDSMGTDLTIVNAARVSFDKHHKTFTDGDEKLIKYLAEHGHWTPFGHPQLQFRISAPVFVARQLVKHQVGLVWNEVSRRYVDSQPAFYIPQDWRSRAVDKKQGSGQDIVHLSEADLIDISGIYFKAIEIYDRLIKKGVAPEQARLMLPQSMITEWYWTGSLYAFSRVCNLRLSEDAQRETKEVAEMIAKFCSKKFPISWKYLIN